MPSPESTVKNLVQWANEFMSGPQNDLGRPTGPREAAFELPLLGYAAGDDPLWHKFKQVASPTHWTPQEAHDLAFPDQTGVAAGELTVISVVLPQTKATIDENRQAKDLPGERWARSRTYGQAEVITGLTIFLQTRLTESGLACLAPELLPAWQWWGQPAAESYGSHWSHRHAALAAGLGTFGLNDGLISSRGQAVRLTSLIVRQKLAATERPCGDDPYGYCLNFSTGACGKCRKRCPAGAISPQGHDKFSCEKYLNEKCVPHIGANWPDLQGGYGCGLCQVAVPCQSRPPLAKKSAERP